MARGRWTTARVAFAQIESADARTPVSEIRGLIGKSLVPGTAIERYGRVWRMGQYQRRHGVIVGRIGYERPGERAELWDEKLNDFIEARLVEGLTSPFALNPENLAIVFQLRAGRIEQTSFTGAFQALLNEAIGRGIWRVRRITQGVDWPRWQESAVRVRHLELRMERPNPNYHGRTQVERIVEGTNARLARLVLDSDPDAGLNLDDPLIQEAIEHAREEYGSVKAVGDVPAPDGGLQESVWRSDVEGSPVESRVEIDLETREARPDELEREVPRGHPDLVEQELREEFVAPPPEPADDDEQ